MLQHHSLIVITGECAAVMRCGLVMSAARYCWVDESDHQALLSQPPQGTPEYATILAFDVKIDGDARKHADEAGVRIFTADIIYHLFDQFTAHMDRLMEQRRQDAKTTAVFPCIAKVSVLHCC